MEDATLRAKCFNVMKEIREIIEHNDSTDDLVKEHEYNHAVDVYQWLMLLYPEKDFSFHIAALGHDIERCIESERIRHENFKSHNEYKTAHSQNSARILKAVMERNRLPQDIIERTVLLVIRHEFGGDEDSDIIKNADSLGNVIWCERVVEKFANDKISHTMERMIDKLSDENRELIKHLNLKTKYLWGL